MPWCLVYALSVRHQMSEEIREEKKDSTGCFDIWEVFAEDDM